MSDNAPTPADFAAPGGWTAPGKEPSAERTSDAVRSGAGGLPPLWKCVWRCLTNREEWEKCRTLSAAAKLLIDEKPDSELGWTLYDMQLARWMLLVGAERRADNGTCDPECGAVPPIDPKLSDSGAWRGSCEGGAKKEATGVRQRRARTRRLRT